MLGIKSKNSFGIDIGTQTIKISEVNKKGSRISVENYAIWSNDIANIIQEKSGEHSLSVEKIVSIIRMMLDSAQMNIKEAYIAIPSYLAFSIVIEMPMLTLEELVTAVPLEAKQHIPVPLGTVQLDWINLGINNSKKTTNILLIAIPNNVINKYKEVSQLLGITIKGFELDVFSMMRSIDIPHRQVCIVDMGARTSTVSIINPAQQLQVLQSFEFGGNHITEKIAKLKNVSLLEADLLKKNNGISGSDSNISASVQVEIREFISNEVLRIIHQTQERSNLKIQDIILLGGFTKMSGMQEFIDKIVRDSPNIDKSMVVSMGAPYSNLIIHNVKDKNLTYEIWKDLVLSIGISLKDYTI